MTSQALKGHCIYRGLVVEHQKCTSCKTPVLAKIFSCELHERCQMFKESLEDVKFCGTCADFCPPIGP
jgi:hypothetical protein